MNKEGKEAVAHLKWLLDDGILSSEDEPQINIVLNLIQKQESIIDKMAEQLTTPVHSKEWIIEFYKKEVEKDVKD